MADIASIPLMSTQRQRLCRDDGIVGIRDCRKAAGFVWVAPRGSIMSINSVNGAGSTSPIQQILSNPVQKQVPADAPAQLPATDRLELSGNSQLLQTLKANSGIRADKVASIKSQIQDGSYDADGTKLDAAIDNLLNELNS